MRRFNQIKRAIPAAFIATIFSLGGASGATRPAGLFHRDYRPGIQQASDSQSKQVEGRWEGALDAGVAKLTLVLHIVRKDGGLSATLDSPNQGAMGLAIDTLSVSEDWMRIEMKSLGAIYEGRIAKDNTQIEGEWRQQNQRFPLIFKRPGQTETAEDRLRLQRVDVGGHILNLLIGGQGSPAVILEGGFGGGISSWSSVQAKIAEFAQVVSYDRAGLGQSEPGPKPRSAKQIALELHTALQTSGINPPYVLVGHSLGGPFIRVFAGMYPRDVAGMVLIDPSQETFDDWAKTHLPPESKEEKAQLAKASRGIRDEAAALNTTYDQARAANLPPRIPITLLTAMQDNSMPAEARKVWAEKQKEWIEKISGGKRIVAKESGHFIQVQEPKLVVDAIREVVKQSSPKRNHQ
jgi:pimeloyl-ACP methyl ester carboxylesterase